MPITIPIEIGDVIRVGKFKNKRITVKEIGLDEYQLPTVNGKGILKIRIEKLMPPKEPKQENNMNKPNKVKLDKMILSMLKEEYPLAEKLEQSEDAPAVKSINIKIKEENKRFWFFLQHEDGTEENISKDGYETIELARHAARMKAFNIVGDKGDKQEDSFNKRPESATDPIKPTKHEPVKFDKPEVIDLGKEKEIKLEILRIAKRVIKEEMSKKKFGNSNPIEQGDLKKGSKYYYKDGFAVTYTGEETDMNTWKTKYHFNVNGRGNYAMTWNELLDSVTLLESFSKKKALTELEVTDTDVVAKIEEMARLSDEMDRLANEMSKLKKQFEPLDDEITKLMDETSKTGDRAIETKNVLITIKKEGYEAKSPKYKESFEKLYAKVNATMKKQADEILAANTSMKKYSTTLAVQYKKTENKINEGMFSDLLNKVKSYFSGLYSKIVNLGKQADVEINNLKRLSSL